MIIPNFKKIYISIFFILTTFSFYSNIFSDLTTDYTITVEIKNKNDQTNDNNKNINDQTDDKVLGNKWYSKQNFYIFHCAELGVSGSKDFLSEYFLFKYKFRSKNKNAFAIRAFHNGYAPGILSNNFTFYHFSILTGFEYFYKIFSAKEGLFFWFDIGGCNNGFSIGTGLGLGSRVKNGIELWALYLHNTGVFSRLEFNFLIFNVFTIRGKIGIDFKFTNFNIEIFTFLSGAYIGFFIKNTFRLELGGGFTVNQYSYFCGFGGVNLTINIF